MMTFSISRRPGKIVDMQIHDSMNMGAAMAMAAVDTILRNFRDLQVDQSYYDKIITGDLGIVGQKIVFEFMERAGYDVRGIHMDCGMKIFDASTQDTHSGGSGCGCAAVTLCSYILPKIQDGTWKRPVFPCKSKVKEIKERYYKPNTNILNH